MQLWFNKEFLLGTFFIKEHQWSWMAQYVQISDETNYHLIMSCGFASQVWKVLESLTGLKNGCTRDSIEKALRS